MKRKTLHLFFVLILLLAAVPVLAHPSVQAVRTAQAAETVLVGLSLPNLEDPFYAGVSNGAEETAAELDLTLLTMTAGNDAATELANVEAMLAQGINVLLISPVDAVASADAIALANTAQVPVVLVGEHMSADLFDAEIAVAVAANEEQGGALAGSVACSLVEDAGVVVELLGAPDDVVAEQRSAGFNDFMAESCADVTVVQFETAGMDRDTFIDAFIALMDVQDVNGVVSLTPATTLPSIEASIIARKGGISFVSFDASDDALNALGQGRLHAIVLPLGWWLGEASVSASLSLATGESVDAAILVDLGFLDGETAVRFGPGDVKGNDPRAGKGRGAHGGDGELEGGDGELEGGDGELEGGDGELEGGDGELEGGDGELEGGDGELEGGDGELEGGDGELE